MTTRRIRTSLFAHPILIARTALFARPSLFARPTLASCRPRARRVAGDEGMATAEYAIATLAAVAFAGLLLTIMRSDEVRSLLFSIIQRALTLG